MLPSELNTKHPKRKRIRPLDSLRAGIELLGEAGNRILRTAIRCNLVTFPAQVPVFKKVTRPDVHARFALLYFVRGWSMSDIADRYGLGRQRVGQIITQWRICAVNQEYVQVIDEATTISHSYFEELSHWSARCAEKQCDGFGTCGRSESRSPVGAGAVTSPAPPAATTSAASSELHLLEELEAINAVLENQLSLRFKRRVLSAADSFGQLLDRAKVLCTLLAPSDAPESSSAVNPENDHATRRLRKALKAANLLLLTLQRASAPSKAARNGHRPVAVSNSTR